jgi:hypothetical protein
MSAQATTPTHSLGQREVLARQGLRLPALTLKRLRDTGIYCQPSISIEHQHLAKRYVLRGVEFGGAVADLGAYSSFVDEHGTALGWLQRVDSVGVNGVHAVAVAPVLVRVEMLRVERTYDLLITRHGLVNMGADQRPRLASSIVFYGRRGTLEMELWGKDATYRGSVAPVFYSRAGEIAAVPVEFQAVAALITTAACCIGCRHCHLLQPEALAPKIETKPANDAALKTGKDNA